MSDDKTPLLSVIVTIASDTTEARASAADLMHCLESLSMQNSPPSMEIIVPCHDAVDGIENAIRRFPDVVFLQVDDLKSPTGSSGSREHHDELKVRGMTVARGFLVGFLEDHIRVVPEWAAEMAEAHRGTFAGVGGAIENGIDRPLNWAVYFCDFGKYQNPVPAGESDFASDANVVYKRHALEAVYYAWQDRFDEPSVNRALRERGERLCLSPGAVIYQHRTNLDLSSACVERYIWGRSYAAKRSQTAGSKRLVYAATAPLLPLLLLVRMFSLVVKKGRHTVAFVRALPLTALLVTCWSWGEFLGYLTGRTD